MEATLILIDKLYKHNEDYGQGRVQRLYEVCLDCKKAADKLRELQRIIDDMYGDHYVDYLEFYANRCRELEEELEKYTALAKNGQSAIETNRMLCNYLMHIRDKIKS